MTSNFKKLAFLSVFFFTNIAFAQTATTDIASTTRFVVPLNSTQQQTIQSLVNANIISNIAQLNNFATITAGAYKLTTGMTIEQVTQTLSHPPYMVWITIPPGLRVEETANILAKNLNWTASQKKNFLAYTSQNYNYLEGVYYPDTYLIPVGEDPKVTYNRLVAKFNEKFSPLQKQFAQQNFPWLKALTLASLVQREAANKDDMPLIAGILLNRLDQRVKLGVDATIQYIRADKNIKIKTATTTAYWAPINIVDKKIVSKYNTYTNYGLPPHPIDSPSINAIMAVLNPASTSCLYYLHDNNGMIHCSETYEGHLQNIQVYLK